MSVYAKEGSGEDQVIARENRLRAFSTPDKVFNFFASYQFEAPGRFLWKFRCNQYVPSKKNKGKKDIVWCDFLYLFVNI